MDNENGKNAKKNPYPRLFRCDECGRCMGLFTKKSSSFFSCASKPKGEKKCQGHYITLAKATEALNESLISVLAKCASKTIFTDNSLSINLKISTYKANMAKLEQEFVQLLDNFSLDNKRTMEAILEECSFYQQLLEKEKGRLIAFSLKAYHAEKFIDISQPFLNFEGAEPGMELISALVDKVLVTGDGQLKIFYKYIGLD